MGGPEGSGDRFLVNYWYAPSVGHAIEGLRYCLGYHAADQSRRVSLILHHAAPTQLAALCPFVVTCHGVDYSPWHGDHNPAIALSAMPPDCEYIIDNHRRAQADQQEFLGGYFDASDVHFRAAKGRALTGRQPPSYKSNLALRLEIPDKNRDWAARRLGTSDLGIAVMPAGSGPSERYPSVEAWELILSELAARHPDARILLTGRINPGIGTSTTWTRPMTDRLLAACPRSVDYFDVGLLDQLALIERCRLFISPHTGFGSAVFAVGTPWLAISGGPWHEYLFNGVPFRSVLPDPDRYPCYSLPGAERVVHDETGDRLVSMCDARIRGDIDRILVACGDLIDGRSDYEESLFDHFNGLLKLYGGDQRPIWSFDNVHESVLGRA
jgi:hypothetical protein